MNNFDEELLLSVNANFLSSGQFNFQVKKINNKIQHLVPFSCILIILSQMTVLSSYHPLSLSEKVVEFLENQYFGFGTTQLIYGTTRLISAFNLEIFKAKNHLIFSQFSPFYEESCLSSDNDFLETDIETILMNYLTAVFFKSNDNEKSNMLSGLIIAVKTYQKYIFPMIHRIKPYDFKDRMELAGTTMHYYNLIYQAWDTPKSLVPGNPLFFTTLLEVKRFNINMKY